MAMARYITSIETDLVRTIFVISATLWENHQSLCMSLRGKPRISHHAKIAICSLSSRQHSCGDFYASIATLLQRPPFLVMAHCYQLIMQAVLQEPPSSCCYHRNLVSKTGISLLLCRHPWRHELRFHGDEIVSNWANSGLFAPRWNQVVDPISWPS